MILAYMKLINKPETHFRVYFIGFYCVLAWLMACCLVGIRCDYVKIWNGEDLINSEYLALCQLLSRFKGRKRTFSIKGNVVDSMTQFNNIKKR